MTARQWSDVNTHLVANTELERRERCHLGEVFHFVLGARRRKEPELSHK